MSLLLQTKEAVGKEMTGATFAISEAVWAAGEFKKKVVEAPQRERALVTVRIRTENVAGVKLPVFTMNSTHAADAELEVLGLAGVFPPLLTHRRMICELLVTISPLRRVHTCVSRWQEAADKLAKRGKSSCISWRASFDWDRCRLLF